MVQAKVGRVKGVVSQKMSQSQKNQDLLSQKMDQKNVGLVIVIKISQKISQQMGQKNVGMAIVIKIKQSQKVRQKIRQKIRQKNVRVSHHLTANQVIPQVC